MNVKQIYTGCLAQGAYYIESEGEVAIIDPLREVDSYIKEAEDNNAKIKYVLETHFHADFVSGHLTLAEKTGAKIVFGPTAKPNFDAHIAEDDEEIKLGNVTIKVLHTPGHTMESSTFLLKDESGKNHSLFTGDTLFLGDVGRPDLAGKSVNMTSEQLAELLYDSLRNKIMPLEDDITVYPGHGAGSACGKNMMKETVDSLGNQKKMNYALRADMTKEEFVQEVNKDLSAPPGYFPANVQMNKEGYQDVQQVTEKAKKMSPEEFETVANQEEALVLDVRVVQDYIQGHIPKSIYIGLDGTFAPWVGELIVDINTPIMLVTPEGREEEAVVRLARIGFDNTLGILEGGFDAWKVAGKEVDQVDSITANQFEDLQGDIKKNSYQIADVRKCNEFDTQHVKNAENISLGEINSHLGKFKDQKSYLYCGSGYRSVIAISILKSRGMHDLVNVEGGIGAIRATGIPLTDEVLACSN